MRILCVGDSLTEGDYGIKGSRGIGNVHAENYPFFLSQMTGAETINAGKCGYTSTSYLKYYKNGNVNAEGADIIIVMLGSNGGLDPSADTQGNADYEELITLLKAASPAARLVVCTPPHVTENPAYSNCGYAERVDKAVRFVRAYAARTGTELIDVAAAPMFTAETESIMQPNDGLHFGEEGYRTLAKFFAEQLGL